ncbi:alpha/beta hydrolase [Streptomyces sp. NPDC049954]|uniref:alpha/beta fold hydrolase n=1 Tax=Streptomyces sp. NPDC049954 TaxID=3155779 RepID=UPI00342EBFD2
MHRSTAVAHGPSAPSGPATAALPRPAREEDAEGATEHQLSFDGFRYVVRSVGRTTPGQDPVLILGGSSQDRFSWMRHERGLAPLGQLLTVDLPGYGDADFLPERYGVDFLAATVRSLLDALGVVRVNLVAACFGGAVGLRFAQHSPGRVRRLMLVGMTRRIPEDYGRAMVRWAGMIERGETGPIAQELTERFMAPPGVGTVRKHAAVTRLVHQQIADQTTEQTAKSAEHNTRLMRHEWYRPEPVPAVPSLVVTGEFDTLTTPDMGREVAASLPAARFLTIRETDHLAPVERTADFADLVVRFCTDQSLHSLPYGTEVESFGSGRR